MTLRGIVTSAAGEWIVCWGVLCYGGSGERVEFGGWLWGLSACESCEGLTARVLLEAAGQASIMGWNQSLVVNRKCDWTKSGSWKMEKITAQNPQTCWANVGSFSGSHPNVMSAIISNSTTYRSPCYMTNG